MSTSARCLAGNVATNRFAWQGAPVPAVVAPVVLPGARGMGPAPVPTIAPAMRDLPSPSAERLLALEREAFAKGYSQGERAGEAATSVRTEAMLQRLVATIEEIASLRAGLMRRAEREMVRLAVSMAERILRREIDVDRELLVVMARVAVDRLGESAVATIHLNPADFEAATARRRPEPGVGAEIVADPNVPRGGCIIRSALGTIDAGIDSQVRELSRALLGEDAQEEEEAANGDVTGG